MLTPNWIGICIRIGIKNGISITVSASRLTLLYRTHTHIYSKPVPLHIITTISNHTIYFIQFYFTNETNNLNINIWAIGINFRNLQMSLSLLVLSLSLSLSLLADHKYMPILKVLILTVVQ